ncbi:MAG: putative ABC transporter permease [Eggerthellaceae bacterium]|nr:putative ABC transporter permease [Eggerthellaceae bacterium]
MDPSQSTQAPEAASSEPAKLKAKIPLLYKLYGLYCLIAGMIVFSLVTGVTVLSLIGKLNLTAGSDNASLTFILNVVQFVLMGIESIVMFVFGISLLRNRRRHAAQIAYLLIAINVIGTLIEIMLRGIGANLVGAGVQLLILIVISVTVDPTLREERRRQRLKRDEELEAEAKAGTLGRAKGDRGFIELDFFNLFWVFVVCSVLGLIIETVFHMVVVDPGVYQDRAGMLFGPFSPIYGVGAVLMTVALNRFYKSNFLIIFLVSAIIGGLFEAFVSWFMQTAFGAVAWNYSGSTIFGLFPDPIAELFGGRTSALFMCMWGALGCVWIKLCLPWLLKLINLIPWQARYGVTTLCAALMLVNSVMTLEALDCWYQRESGYQPTSPVEKFYAKYFDDDYMAHRFQSMTITPDETARVDAGTADRAS